MTGAGNQSKTPYLFSALENRTTLARKPEPLQTFTLPNNLSSALSHLDDSQLDRLFAALLSEQERRGKKHPSSNAPSNKRRIETAAVPLTISKVNAIRAAFKAGVTPSMIAKQFGVPQSEVRKALASYEKK
jgi:hypothetical protein